MSGSGGAARQPGHLPGSSRGWGGEGEAPGWGSTSSESCLLSACRCALDGMTRMHNSVHAENSASLSLSRSLSHTAFLSFALYLSLPPPPPLLTYSRGLFFTCLCLFLYGHSSLSTSVAGCPITLAVQSLLLDMTSSSSCLLLLMFCLYFVALFFC